MLKELLDWKLDYRSPVLGRLFAVEYNATVYYLAR